MKYPLRADPDSLQIPKGSNCLVCEEKVGEVGGFVRLTTGAILYWNKKRQVGGPSELMDSIFRLWYHGPHPSRIGENGRVEILSMDNAEHRMDIVSATAGG